jgi:hypothetical protein
MKHIHYYCFQPIHLSYDVFSLLNKENYIPQKDDWLLISNSNSDENIGDCLNNIKCNKPWFSRLRKIEKHDLYLHQLNPEIFNEKIKKINISNIDTFTLCTEETTFGIFYDYSYKLFFIIMNVAVAVNDNINYLSLLGLHDKIRNELVVDTPNKNLEVSEWAKSIREYSISLIAKSIPHKLKNNDVLISDNTGYVVSMFDEFLFNDNIDICQYKNSFLQTNHKIDMVNEQKYKYSKLSILNSTCPDTQSLSEKESYGKCNSIVFFGWRFSTVFGIKKSQFYDLIPIFINLQNIYFIVNLHYKPIIGNLFKTIRYSDDYVLLSENLEEFDKLVVSYENLIFEKKIFFSEYKPHQQEIFNLMEEYWNLDYDYSTVQNTISICQTSLKRKLEVKTNNIQQKQNDILFILTIVQIFSVVSIFGDYFNLFSMDVVKEHEKVRLLSTTYIIYFLGFGSVLLVYIGYSERIWFKIKHILRNIFPKKT